MTNLDDETNIQALDIGQLREVIRDEVRACLRGGGVYSVEEMGDGFKLTLIGLRHVPDTSAALQGDGGREVES